MPEQTTEDQLTALTAYVDRLHMAAMQTCALVALTMFAPTAEGLAALSTAALRLAETVEEGVPNATD